MRPVGDHVDGLRLGADGHARRVVEPVALVDVHPQAVHLLPASSRVEASRVACLHPEHVPVAARWAATARHVQRVAQSRLVVELRDGALGARAKGILCSRVRKATRTERKDVQPLAVVRAHDLVEGARVGAKERADGTVRRHAGRASRGEDVARRGVRGRKEGEDKTADGHLFTTLIEGRLGREN